jgi:hypothetical protein
MFIARRQRLLRTRIAAVLVALAFAVPFGPATGAAAGAQVVVEGRLALVVKEDFDAEEAAGDTAGDPAGDPDGDVAYDAFVETAEGRVELRLDGELPAGFENGATVRIRGRRVAGGTLAFDGDASSASVLATSPEWTGPRRIAVALINFSNDTSRPFSKAFANGVVFTNANSVRAYYLEQSHGTLSITGTTFDWMKIPKSNTTCDWAGWEAAAKKGLAARGIDLGKYTNLMLVFPKVSACHWRGMGYMPGGTSWINGAPRMRVVAHELGHNLGVHHAQSLRCTKNGVRVALSGKCTKREYGDPFSTMGASWTRHMHNLELVQMGIMPPEATRTVVATGRFTLTHASATTGTRIIGIPRGNGTALYLEFRRPYGTYFDNFSSTNPAVRGVTIRIAGGWSQITQTQLIDTRPSTTSFADAPLSVGRTFRDYKSGTTIKVISVSSTAAVVYITMPPDITAPAAPAAFSATLTSPTDVTLSWGAAADNRAVAGYRIWRDGVLIATLGAQARSLVDPGRAASTTYTYTIRAIDAAGNASTAVGASITTGPIEASLAPVSTTAP